MTKVLPLSHLKFIERSSEGNGVSQREGKNSQTEQRAMHEVRGRILTNPSDRLCVFARV